MESNFKFRKELKLEDNEEDNNSVLARICETKPTRIIINTNLLSKYEKETKRKLEKDEIEESPTNSKKQRRQKTEEFVEQETYLSKEPLPPDYDLIPPETVSPDALQIKKELRTLLNKLIR